jgi:hypothetical protein
MVGWGVDFISKMENTGVQTDGIYHLYAVIYFMYIDE